MLYLWLVDCNDDGKKDLQECNCVASNLNMA